MPNKNIACGPLNHLVFFFAHVNTLPRDSQIIYFPSNKKSMSVHCVLVQSTFGRWKANCNIEYWQLVNGVLLLREHPLAFTPPTLGHCPHSDWTPPPALNRAL